MDTEGLGFLGLEGHIAVNKIIRVINAIIQLQAVGVQDILGRELAGKVKFDRGSFRGICPLTATTLI